MDVSRRVQAIPASATLAISQRAAELRKAGRDVISLSAGEPDFDTPEDVAAAARTAIDEHRTRYTAVAGVEELRHEIARTLVRDQGLEYSASEILVSNGAKQALFNAVLALAERGDEVLIPAPYWVSYPAIAALADAAPVYLPTHPRHGFKIQPEDLEAALARRCRVFLFNSPNNPTGAVYSRAELAALGDVLARHPVWIVTDEIYEKLVFGGAEHHSLAAACPGLRDRIIVVNGLSKAYAMTGWRIGFAAGPPAVIKAMERVQGHSTSNACTVSQYAALAALRGDSAVTRRMCETFARRRERVLAALAEVPGLELVPPHGAFYVFPDVSRWYRNHAPGSVDLCRAILEEAEVALVPGAAFGEDRCLRISYAQADDLLDVALARLRKFFSSRQHRAPAHP